MQSNPEMIQAREELKEEFLNTHPQYAKMTSEELQESMTHHALEDEKLRKQKLRHHIEAFADGIIAVIITIMLLEIPVPSGNQGYWEFISSVGIFLVSFVVTANFWFNSSQDFCSDRGNYGKNYCSRFYLYWFAFTNSAVDQMDYGCSNII